MTDKSVCIVGPGAIGGMLAVKLKQAGVAVTALARPEKAKAVAPQSASIAIAERPSAPLIAEFSSVRQRSEHD